MVDKKVEQEIKSLERRNFLSLAGTAGFTTAIVAVPPVR